MKHFLLIYYALATFSGIIGFTLIILMIAQNLRKLALVYATFISAFSLLILNILLQYYGYFILNQPETPSKLWIMTLIIFVSKNLFFLGFGFTMFFLFKNEKLGKFLSFLEFTATFLGIVFSLWLFSQGFTDKNLKLLLFFDQWIWGSALVVFLSTTLFFLWLKKLPDLTHILASHIRHLLILTTFFLPLFLVDNLWELFQVQWKILPRCFNFSPLYYTLWNFMTFAAMIQFLIERKLWLNELIYPIPEKWEGIHLSKREREIISLLIQGYDNPIIASKLYITEHTVRNYISRLYEKTETSNRIQLIQKFSFLLQK
ncbi:helix-turn-helix domain-containing protein [Thermospira aquatica]|uniref:Helix-turn-helix transcriptional regulator n=1 Tax=Thermospira aquatica TaxID=2828656 RepID=A0AAX3BB20_9SPIR|nr:helix-turn-helix transcriptional regulator [Thermospira aquatica]URA09434.1 helix-turn-helix transcriptional regulator [Thermospira aquatica]